MQSEAFKLLSRVFYTKMDMDVTMSRLVMFHTLFSFGIFTNHHRKLMVRGKNKLIGMANSVLLSWSVNLLVCYLGVFEDENTYLNNYPIEYSHRWFQLIAKADNSIL